MPDHRTIYVAVEVKVPNHLDMDDGDVACLISKMIDVCLADAVDSDDEPDIGYPDAENAAALDIGVAFASEARDCLQVLLAWAKGQGLGRRRMWRRTEKILLEEVPRYGC